MTKLEAVELTGFLVGAYATPAWSQESIRAYREFLQDLDHGVTDLVVREWIRTRDQRPAIADVRRAVAERQGELAAGYRFLPPDEAWGFVMQCFRSVGRYQAFPDTYPLVREAVNDLGWAELCASENLDVTRAQFRKAYEARLERSLREAAASPGAAQIAHGSSGRRELGRATPLLASVSKAMPGGEA